LILQEGKNFFKSLQDFFRNFSKKIMPNAEIETREKEKQNGGAAPGLPSHKFLFVSFESLSGDLAWHLVKEGHAVKCCIKSKNDADVYNGFLEKVERWEEWVEWADVILFDDVDFGDQAEKLRRKGKKVIGGSPYTDKLEIDREFGQAELKKYGVATLPNWNFSSYDEAVTFLKETPGRYVFKPSGNIPSSGKDLLFLGEEEDGRDIIEMLEQNKKVFQKKAPTFQLQKFVSGIEIAVGAFFNGNEFIQPINVNFEHKRLFPGDIGLFTGEIGTLMFWSSPNTLFKATLGKMLPALKESGYIGYIDINCIVNGRGIYPLEWTARLGYPTVSVQLEGIAMSAGEWLWRLSSSENFELKTKRGFQIGVSLMVPPFLTSRTDKETTEIYHDLPILFRKPGNLDGIHIYDVKREDGVWRVAGTSGYLLVVTGSGTTVVEAQRQAYSRVQNVMAQNMFYRTDIGAKWVEDGDKLHTWGYLD
jgi:phosphoribosylamine--glycine ligase